MQKIRRQLSCFRFCVHVPLFTTVPPKQVLNLDYNFPERIARQPSHETDVFPTRLTLFSQKTPVAKLARLILILLLTMKNLL